MKTNRILAAVLTVIMVLAAVFIGLQSKPVARDSSLYITDKAGVISAAGESAFVNAQKSCKARLSVAIVRSTGKLSTAKYCEALWNEWKLGTSDMLLLMVTGKQDYYFGYDTGASYAWLLDSQFDVLMEAWLEPDFAAGHYERAILTFSDGVQQALLGTDMGNSGLFTDDYYTGSSSGMSMVGLLIIIAFIVIFVAVVAAGSVGKTTTRRTRTVYRTPTPPRSTYRPAAPSRPRTTSRPASRPVTPPVSRPRTTIRTSTSSRPRSSGFGGGSRPRSGGFGGGGRSGGFGGGGRSGGMGGKGRR